MKLFTPLTISKKDNCDLCRIKTNKKTAVKKLMTCDMCKNDNSVHYRVINSQISEWIFICNKCWLDFSKTEGYKYGGTRKENRRKKFRYTNQAKT